MNQLGDLAARIFWSVMNFERLAARKPGKDTDMIPPHPWQDHEVEKIGREVLAERPRGGDQRWRDDLQVGQTFDEITKGPIGLTDEVAFIAGGGDPIPRLAAHRAALQDHDAHPAWAFREPTTNALEPVCAIHYSWRARLWVSLFSTTSDSDVVLAHAPTHRLDGR